MRKILEQPADRSRGVDPRRDDSWHVELKPAPLVPVPPSCRAPKVESDPDVRAVAEARRKRIRGWIAGALALLAAPLGYLGKGIVDSWTESRKVEDAAVKARHDKFVELAAKLDVKPVTEEGVVAELVARVAKCEAAAAKTIELDAKHEKLESRFYGYIEATGSRVRRTDDMAQPAAVKITPAPAQRKPSVFAPRPEVRFPTAEKP